MELEAPPGVRMWELGLDLPDEELAMCSGILSIDERERADRYVLPTVRSRFVVGRARLRSILGEVLGVPGEALRFDYGTYGKPTLSPPWDGAGYHFSLSHSADRALLAIAHGCEIGCDLEAHRKLRYGRAVAKRFFSEGENAELSRIEDEAWPAAFFRIWTLKEAFIKAVGAGLSFPTRRFTVTIGDGADNRLVEVHRDPDARAHWRLDSVRVREGFAAAVCVARAS